MAAVPNNVFSGYSQDKLKEIAQGYGYSGNDLAGFGGFLEQNPDIAARYFAQQDQDMLSPNTGQKQFQTGGLQEFTAQRAVAPALPYGTAYEAVAMPFEQAQLVPSTLGQVTTDVTVPSAAQVTAAQATAPTSKAAPQVAAAAATPDVRDVAAQAAQLQAPSQTIEAQQQAQSSIANMQAAHSGGVEVGTGKNSISTISARSCNQKSDTEIRIISLG